MAAECRGARRGAFSRQAPALIGQKLDDVETKYRIRIIANKLGGQDSQVGPGTLARDTEFQPGMVLGIVVDDAIIVGENIHAKRQLGLPPADAVREGVREMVVPVLYAIFFRVKYEN